MTTTEMARAPYAIGTVSLLFGALGGPIAWSLHLLVSLALIPIACPAGGQLPFHLVTLAAGALAALAVLVSWRNLQVAQALGPDSPTNGWGMFLARYGILSSVFFLFVTLVEGIPVFFLLPPCW